MQRVALNSVRLASVLATLTLAACSVDAPLPPGVQLTCTGAADCPEGFDCNATLGRCVSRSRADSEPPGLASPLELTRTLLRTGDVTTLVVDASEPLAVPPLVTLRPEGRAARTLVRDGAESSGQRHVFTYTAAGDEPEGVDVPLEVVLIDAGGNQTSVGATLRFDRTPPVLSSVEVTGVPARAGGTYRVDLVSNEPLRAAPTVRRAGGGAALVLESQPAGPLSYRFAGQAAGTESATDGLVLTAEDAAGNAVELTVPGVLAFDFEPPALTATEVATPFVRQGFSAIVRLTFSEALSAPPALQLVPRAGGPSLALTVGEQLGTRFSVSRSVLPADAAGIYDVRLVAASDFAGNPAAAVTLGSLEIDKTSPAITAGPTLNRDPGLFRTGMPLQVDFTVGEPLSAAPDVRLGGSTGRALSCASPATNAYRCTITVDGAQDAEGNTALLLSLVDRAGNQGATSVGLTLDYTAPSVLPGSVQLQLTPPDDAVPSPTRATVGTQVRVAFALSEPTGSTPGVTATSGATTLVFDSLTASGLLFGHTLVPGTYPQGTYAVSVAVQDAVGNAAVRTLTLPAPGLVVDTVAPAAPLQGTANLVYHRAPWGRIATAGVREFWVDGGAGTAEVGAQLRILDPEGAELGRVSVASNGSVPRVEAGRVDRPLVYAQVLDAAGNRSAPTEVREVEWVATLAGKRPGSFLENPTRLVATSRFGAAREPPSTDSAEPGAAQLALTVAQPGVGLSATTVRSWRRMGASSATPGPRWRAAMATDLARGKVVLFGSMGTTTSDDTWELDLATGLWAQREPIGDVPAPRIQHRMVYDARRGRVQLFGGGNANGSFNDVWEWDGAASSWTRLDTGGGLRPSARRQAQVAYDTRRGRLVVFGGAQGVSFLGDLWEFDAATGTWLNRTPSPLPAGAWPGGRAAAAFAHDADRGVTVLAHGSADPDWGTPSYDDVWEWDGVQGTWANRSAVAHGPSLANIAATFDASRGRVVFIGGDANTEDAGNVSNAVWEYDGTTWFNRTATASIPPVTLAAAAFDPLRGGVVYHGGAGADFPDETWEWLGGEGRVLDLTPRGEPSNRDRTKSAFDPARRLVYLFGGNVPSVSTNFADLWAYDTRTGHYRDLTPAVLPAAWPEARTDHALAYDTARGRLMLFGGRNASTNLNDLWSYNPATGTWTRLFPAGGPPAARRFAGMVYDSVRQRLVLFGGSTTGAVGDLWEWVPTAGVPDGSGSWVSRTTGPAARSSPGMGFDPARGRTVVFGGSGAAGQLNDVWEWDGVTWFNRTPGTLPALWPSVRGSVQAAWDTQRGELLVHGGNCTIGGSIANCTQYEGARLWRWHGGNGTWVSETADDALPDFGGGAAAFDSVQGRLVVTGATTASQGRTWEYLTGSTERPALVWTVPFAAADAPGAVVSSVRLVADAGGWGSTAAAPASAVTGVQLYAWDAPAAEWRTAALPTSAAPGAPAGTARLEATFATPATIDTLRHGEQDAVTFALAPNQVAGNLGPDGEVWVDGLELVVRYRR